MNIVNFEHKHITRAMEIAFANYEEERLLVSSLPKVDSVPDLKYFADNHLGVAAFDGEVMLGFLCNYYPNEDAFGTTGFRGIFSPIHAHGVIPASLLMKEDCVTKYNRERIYSLLFQGAADKWVREGVRIHAVALYTHDEDANRSFFYNGFGLRCIDAIRSLEEIPALTEVMQINNDNLVYCEVPRMEWSLLLEYNNALINHLGEGPIYMKYSLIDEEELYRRSPEGTRYFAVKVNGNYAAYIKISKEGENFATVDGSMMNISGAYCNPIYRGTGLYHNLLCHLMTVLKQEGYQRLGVDCESFNPTAKGFWLKYFTEYTHSLVRHIDDKVFLN